ncbi:2-hydroxyacyl-CoA dehydratase subunit D [Aurantivibrio infirmus]
MNDTLLEPIQSIINDRRSQARKWKSKGGKVVGYLSNNIPLELIEAAGMMPFHLNGDPKQNTEHADEFMEPAFDPITRVIFDSLLKGDFEFVDLILLPRSNDAQQRLYYYICEIQRKHPHYKLPPVFLVDLLSSPRATTEKHNLLKFKEFLTFLESFTESVIDEQKISAAIKSYNLVRNQLREFNHYRADPNSALSSLDAYHAYSATQCLTVEDLTQALTKILATLEEKLKLKTRDDLEVGTKKRFILAGNGVDHPDLHRFLDSLGATVAGDYHSYGNHFLVTQINEEIDPLEAITEHYYRDTKSSRSFNFDPEEIVRFAKQQNASGILFHYLKKEEAITWLYPKQQLAAKEHGLKVVMLPEQDYETKTDVMQPLLQDFIDSL